MNGKYVKFIDVRKQPTTRDGIDYDFTFSIVDYDIIGKPEEKNKTISHIIRVGISGTLNACWGLSEDNLIKVLFEFAKRNLQNKLKEGTLGEHEELVFTTANIDSSKPPFDPDRIDYPGKGIHVIMPAIQIEKNLPQLELASRIIDLRDNINAIFKERHKKSLLILPQERGLVELMKNADSQEEFMYRLSALATLSSSLNLEALRNITGINDKTQKSIALLEAYLSKQNGDCSDITNILKNINRLRQGYPTHGDQVDGVIKSFKFFNIEYPISDYDFAWKTLVLNYLHVLELLLEHIKQEK
ncbi:MAG TPA: hypothetical protein VFD03_03415 [Clostridia bacterium]|nr:hypothetical protein [Clostridia bacterium]